MDDYSLDICIPISWLSENSIAVPVASIAVANLLLSDCLPQLYDVNHSLTGCICVSTETDNSINIPVELWAENTRRLTDSLPYEYCADFSWRGAISDAAETDNSIGIPVELWAENTRRLTDSLPHEYCVDISYRGDLSDAPETDNFINIPVELWAENTRRLTDSLPYEYCVDISYRGDLSDAPETDDFISVPIGFWAENTHRLTDSLPYEYCADISYHGDLSDAAETDNSIDIPVELWAENTRRLTDSLPYEYCADFSYRGDLSDAPETDNFISVPIGFWTENTHRLTDSLPHEFCLEISVPVEIIHEYCLDHSLKDSIAYDGFCLNHTYRGRIGAPQTTFVTAENYALWKGQRIQVLDATGLSIDSSKFAWSATLQLVNWADFKVMRPNDDIMLILQGDAYVLMIDDQGINRDNSPKLDLSLSCVSPTVRLDNTTYSQVNQTWRGKTPVEIITEILPTAFTLVWEADNTPIQEYIATSKSIMAVIRELAERIGAIVQTRRDGYAIEVYAFYRFKPWEWGQFSLPASHRFERGNLSLQRRWGKQREWNSVVISDEDQAPNCTMENIDNKMLRLYPFPFREMDVGTSRRSGVGISQLRYQERAERECNLEVKDGKASVKYPILRITEYSWGENEDLGELLFNVDEKDITVSIDNMFKGTSLLAGIEYVTRYWECDIAQPAATTVQYLAIEKD